jgi:hypothetical protein
MNSNTRFTHEDADERPMPERPIRPTFEVPKVLVTDGVLHANHYRTTMLDAPSAVFITLTGPWQEDHEHFFEDLTRFGDGNCVGCGANAWSASWVAEQVFGDNTANWAAERARGLWEQVQPSVEVVVAHLSMDEPANNGRRAGLKVPLMEYLRLS